MKKAIPLILIMAVLVANVIYWGSQKEGFHVDEMFSYEQVGNTEYPKPEYDRPDEPCMNTWHSREYFMDYLSVSSDEAFDLAAFYQSASRNGAHPPLYLTLLGMWISAVSPDHFTKWSGISFNLFFFVFALIVLYDLARCLYKKEETALIAVSLCGVCAGMVSAVVFIRDYMMLICFSLAFFDLHVHLVIGKQHSPVHQIEIFVLVFITMFLGLMTHFYFVVFAFFVCITYWVFLLFLKKWTTLIRYTLTCATGVLVYIMVYPQIFEILKSGHRGQEAINNLVASTGDYWGQLAHLVHMADLRIMGGAGILVIAIAIIMAVIAGWKPKLLENKDGAPEIHINTAGISCTLESRWLVFFMIILVTLGYLFVVTRIAPVLWLDKYKDVRYIFILFPLFSLSLFFIVEHIVMRFSMNHIGAVMTWLICGLLVLSSYFMCGVDYLYPGAESQLESLEPYSEERAIFITEAPYFCSNLNVYFTKTKAVYATTLSNLPQLHSSFEEIDGQEILVYISSDTENMKEVLSSLYTQFDVKGATYLFETTGRHTADVFLMQLR